VAILTVFDFLIVVFTVLSIGYQVLCIIVSIFAKPMVFPRAEENKRYAVLISARNEENVIGGLIRSIRANSYPQELVDIWIVADNCSDSTAQIARSLGGKVVVRNDSEHIGKGFALTYLLNQMIKTGAAEQYDAFFVFDADNRIDTNYFSEMNKAFSSGFKIVTSYRNSRNLSTNWVSAGSALWFIRESRILNSTRMFLHLSSNVSGTGYMFSREIMERNDGWEFHLLTEDIEFTIDSIIKGDRIGYCGTAYLYDEQPVSFRQSWRQRLRWSKGFLQAFRYYTPELVRAAFVNRDFSAIDMTLIMFPFAVLAVIRVVLGFIFAACGFVTFSSQVSSVVSIVVGAIGSVLFMMALAALTCILERDRIGATNKELVAYCLSFPIYMLSTIPISYQAIFARPQWKPIEHHGQE
jgi:cellulose synthase/poly-beta-1,6-N-acetylglucosamine synthase-like glycosyltransferase